MQCRAIYLVALAVTRTNTSNKLVTPQESINISDNIWLGGTKKNVQFKKFEMKMDFSNTVCHFRVDGQ